MPVDLFYPSRATSTGRREARTGRPCRKPMGRGRYTAVASTPRAAGWGTRPTGFGCPLPRGSETPRCRPPSRRTCCLRRWRRASPRWATYDRSTAERCLHDRPRLGCRPLVRPVDAGRVDRDTGGLICPARPGRAAAVLPTFSPSRRPCPSSRRRCVYGDPVRVPLGPMPRSRAGTGTPRRPPWHPCPQAPQLSGSS